MVEVRVTETLIIPDITKTESNRTLLHISFKENNGKSNQKVLLPFLTQKTTRQDDGSITVSVYRKATRTDRYLDFKSHHHPQHKYSVVRTLMDRAKNIPSTEEEAVRETKRVAEALTANNYPTNFIYNGRQRNRHQEVNDSDLFGQSQTYLKNQKTRSTGRPPEESCTRSNAKIVIVFTLVRHRAR